MRGKNQVWRKWFFNLKYRIAFWLAHRRRNCSTIRTRIVRVWQSGDWLIELLFRLIWGLCSARWRLKSGRRTCLLTAFIRIRFVLWVIFYLLSWLPIVRRGRISYPHCCGSLYGTLHRKFEISNPRNETRPLVPEFVYLWAIYKFPWSAYFTTLRLRTDRGNI